MLLKLYVDVPRRFQLDVPHRFQSYPPQVLNSSAGGRTTPQFLQILRDLEKSDFLKSSFMRTRGVKCHPW